MRGYRGWWVLCLSVLWSGCSKTSPTAPQTSYCEVPSEGVSIHGFSTGLPAQYHLSREGTQYTATIKPKFVDPSPDHSKIRFAAGMRNRAESCIAEIEPYLLGPQGETLRIRFAAEDDSSIPITVTSEQVRGHYRLWQSSWSCGQIVHEIFHILGLVDEYAESGFACRAVGPADSIMADPYASYVAIFTTRARQSLLYPAQFNAIVAPGCQSRNSLYYSCSTYAYRNTDCESVPQECGAALGDWLNH